jgi:dTDP-3-amino-3,4,6-trideoxy-alpha-D-glucose transaminase
VLCDIDPTTYTISPAAVRSAIGPRSRAIVPVHLYGHPADMVAIGSLAARHGLAVVEDCAQAHGARLHGRRVGTFGELAAFSFYPTKNLGALGDGGAVVTDDAALAERLRRLRNLGQRGRYHHVERGQNSRLDELQAAILRVKLAHLDRHNETRRGLAAAYRHGLKGVSLPGVEPGCEHVFHLFVTRHPLRDELQRGLAARGVETLIHYPIPVHLQEGYRSLGVPPGRLPQTEAAAREILSLPLFVGLETRRQEEVLEAVEECSRSLGGGC